MVKGGRRVLGPACPGAVALAGEVSRNLHITRMCPRTPRQPEDPDGAGEGQARSGRPCSRCPCWARHPRPHPRSTPRLRACSTHTGRGTLAAPPERPEQSPADCRLPAVQPGPSAGSPRAVPLGRPLADARAPPPRDGPPRIGRRSHNRPFLRQHPPPHPPQMPQSPHGILRASPPSVGRGGCRPSEQPSGGCPPSSRGSRWAHRALHPDLGVLPPCL